MRRVIVLTMTALLMSGGTVGADDALKKELELLQGRWEMIGREFGGKKATPEELKRVKGIMVIEGAKKTGWSEESGKKVNVQETTIKLNPTAHPKTVDKAILSGIGKGETMLGIYKLEGDQLTICLALDGKERPTAFAAKADGQALVVVYKRVKK